MPAPWGMMMTDLVVIHCEASCRCEPRPGAVGGRCRACDRFIARCEHLSGERTCALLEAAADPRQAARFVVARCHPQQIVGDMARKVVGTRTEVDPRDITATVMVRLLARGARVYPPELSADRGGFRGYARNGLRNAMTTAWRRVERHRTRELDENVDAPTFTPELDAMFARVLEALDEENEVWAAICRGRAQGLRDHQIARGLNIRRETVSRKYGDAIVWLKKYFEETP